MRLCPRRTLRLGRLPSIPLSPAASSGVVSPAVHASSLACTVLVVLHLDPASAGRVERAPRDELDAQHDRPVTDDDACGDDNKDECLRGRADDNKDHDNELRGHQTRRWQYQAVQFEKSRKKL